MHIVKTNLLFSQHSLTSLLYPTLRMVNVYYFKIFFPGKMLALRSVHLKNIIFLVYYDHFEGHLSYKQTIKTCPMFCCNEHKRVTLRLKAFI